MAGAMSSEHRLMPIFVALLGVGFLSLMDAFMKEAALVVGAYSAAVLRSAMGAALVAPVWLARGGRWPSRAVLRIHIRRGLVTTFMALTFFYAITKLPLAETIAISFIAPVISLYLAALILGERIERKAIVAAVLGLIGTLVIVGGRIGGAEMSDDAALGLAAIVFSAVLYAYNLVLARQQAQLAGPLEIASFHSGMSALVLGLAAPFLLTLPEPAILGSIAAAAALTVCGAISLAWAYARAEAQVLVPMEYSGFLWAVLFGWLFFREAVTPATLAGTALIVGGCWIAARKRPEQVAI
jgi:drug/metabolite transporter (DMT)-like permease